MDTRRVIRLRGSSDPVAIAYEKGKKDGREEQKAESKKETDRYKKSVYDIRASMVAKNEEIERLRRHIRRVDPDPEEVLAIDDEMEPMTIRQTGRMSMERLVLAHDQGNILPRITILKLKSNGVAVWEAAQHRRIAYVVKKMKTEKQEYYRNRRSTGNSRRKLSGIYQDIRRGNAISDTDSRFLRRNGLNMIIEASQWTKDNTHAITTENQDNPLGELFDGLIGALDDAATVEAVDNAAVAEERPVLDDERDWDDDDDDEEEIEIYEEEDEEEAVPNSSRRRRRRGQRFRRGLIR